MMRAKPASRVQFARVEDPFGRHASQQRCELLAAVLNDVNLAAVTKCQSPISTFTVEYWLKKSV